ncbi:hypothetical protein [Nostoc sp. 'Peltigera membranacea cyanobiont' 232]|uniref:hypothetical protein n=1 Tax=Nostoc sp. 'Peltigera membranacea cyanobiont' 232 TaxID=2014531 RepID=UPI001CB8CA0B|nr:hypothetical protein [Nostoc sp. 'Peltigera membranacea cyanobiont' 232]
MESVNFAEVIAQTDVEMQRLGWTIDQGREHLKKTYGKRSRFLLTEVQLLGFLQYLESQTLDEVVTAKINLDIEQLCWMEQQGQINAEIQRLCWMKEEEQKYVIKTSRKQNTNLLTQEELLEFVKYLESEPTVEYASDLDEEYEEFQDCSTYSKKSDKVITKISSKDLSQVLAKTDIEIQRLGWTPEQGREYLIKTYGKRGRTLLTEEELHQFLQYLQSQPDPIAGF